MIIQDLIQFYSFYDLVLYFPPLYSKGNTLDLLFASPSSITIVPDEIYLIKTDEHHKPTYFLLRPGITGVTTPK